MSGLDRTQRTTMNIYHILLFGYLNAVLLIPYRLVFIRKTVPINNYF